MADYESFSDSYHRIGHFIEDVYQAKRIHSALGCLTPAEFEAVYWAEHASDPRGAYVPAVTPQGGLAMNTPICGPKSVQTNGGHYSCVRENLTRDSRLRPEAQFEGWQGMETRISYPRRNPLTRPADRRIEGLIVAGLGYVARL